MEKGKVVSAHKERCGESGSYAHLSRQQHSVINGFREKVLSDAIENLHEMRKDIG
jgi:hypothetical protein